MSKEQLTLRLEKELFEKIKKIADKEYRSTNAQCEFFLVKAVQDYTHENKTNN